jgi:tRNA threonylcarbamoyladenosine biosynthesis protein TsaE
MMTVSKGDLEGFVKRFLVSLLENPKGEMGRKRTKATVVALSGDLGAGKTTFTQTLACVLGVTGPVTSPTYVIEQVYDLPEGNAFDHLVHIDAYRLEGGEELEKLGWKDLTVEPSNLVVIEWAEKVEDILPEDTVWLTFEVVGEEERKISIRPTSCDECSR